MTLRSSDLQSDGDLDSIRNSCDVIGKYDHSKLEVFSLLKRLKFFHALKVVPMS